jgi:hypothetical protein
MLGQEEMIRETMMPPSINSTISAASFTSALKIMSPPGGLNAGLVAAINYSLVSGQKNMFTIFAGNAIPNNSGCRHSCLWTREHRWLA